MGDLALKIGGQVDDVDGAERTLFGTDTTSNTETLGDKRDLRLGSDFDAEFASANHRARLLTLLTTFLDVLVSKRN